MGLAHQPKIVTDGLDAVIDINHPRCYNGGTQLNALVANVQSIVSGTGSFTYNNGIIINDGSGGSLTWARSINWAETSFTFSGWGNRDDLDDDREGRIVDVVNAGNGHLRLTLATNPSFRFRPTAGSGYNLVTATQTINAGQWYNLVVTKEGQTSGGSASYKMYLNGEQIATNTSTGLVTDSNFTRYRVMRSSDDDQSGISWLGKFGPFCSYTKALTDAEVLQNYNATKSRFL